MYVLEYTERKDENVIHQEFIERRSAYKGACSMGRERLEGQTALRFWVREPVDWPAFETRSPGPAFEGFTLLHFHLHPVLGGTERGESN